MTRPLPTPTAETKPFWDGCAVGELRYQVCRRCASVQPIPRSLCASCQHGVLQWGVSARRGRILSHTTVHRAPLPAFRAEVPYVIAILDMDEGFRLMVNVRDGAGRALSIGQPVRVGFTSVDGVVLPIAELDE